jgi:hypothetical protein
LRHAHEAVVFIVSRSSNTPYRRVLWRVSIEDAKAICSDQRTASHHYMLVWTADEIEDSEINRFVRDSGRHRPVLSELGVTVLDSYELRNGRAAA